MHDYCIFINVHLNCHLLLEQFHILFTSHLCTRGQQVQSNGAKIVPKIIWLSGYFIVDIMNFSSNLLTGSLFTFLVRSTNCCASNSSENKTLPNVLLFNLHICWKNPFLIFIAEVRHDLRADLCGSRPNSLLRRRNTVRMLTFFPLEVKLHVCFYTILTESVWLYVSSCSRL